jgi:hypothetical protein
MNVLVATDGSKYGQWELNRAHSPGDVSGARRQGRGDAIAADYLGDRWIGRIAASTQEWAGLSSIVQGPNTKIDRRSLRRLTCPNSNSLFVRSPGSVLDDIGLECPDLTWNQIFVVIDRLSREGVLTMSPKGRGQYAITFSTDHAPTPLTAPMCERAQVNAPT